MRFAKGLLETFLGARRGAVEKTLRQRPERRVDAHDHGSHAPWGSDMF